jgi:hypothetical protein
MANGDSDARTIAKMPARIASGSLGHAWITATNPASICPPAPSAPLSRRDKVSENLRYSTPSLVWTVQMEV